MQDREKLAELYGYWLSKRPNSPFWCRTWFDPRERQTRRASLGTADLDEAKLALAAWVVANGRVEKQRPETVFFETCLVRYYEQHAKQLPSGEPTRYASIKWCEFFPGALVAEVTPERQREFVAALRVKGLSYGYIRRILAVGQAALKRAYREGEISSHPAILLALAPEGEPRERLFTLAEARALFDAAGEPHQLMYLLLAFGTAARPKAILELTSFQIDCEARLIRLNPPGRRQNKKRRPTVPICNTLLPYLRFLPAGPVVRYAGRALGGIKSTFDHLTRRAGISGASAYTVRHTVAVEMRKRGVPVWEVAGRPEPPKSTRISPTTRSALSPIAPQPGSPRRWRLPASTIRPRLCRSTTAEGDIVRATQARADRSANLPSAVSARLKRLKRSIFRAKIRSPRAVCGCGSLSAPSICSSARAFRRAGVPRRQGR
jgi:integrase